MQEIIDRANVGRATFYAHFDNKGDLLVSGLDGFARHSRSASTRHSQSEAHADERLLAFSLELFAHASGHRNLFRAMVGKRSGALVQQMLREMIVDVVRDDVTAMASPRETGSTPTEAVVRFVAGGLFGLLVWWLGENAAVGPGRQRDLSPAGCSNSESGLALSAAWPTSTTS